MINSNDDDDDNDGDKNVRKRKAEGKLRQKGRGLASRNDPPSDEPPHPNSPEQQIKNDFADRLAGFILKKGWNQSETARYAALHMPSKQFNRDNVSNYVTAKHTPTPVHLRALCKALGVEPIDLFPSGSAPPKGDATPPLDLKDLGDGTMFVRINKRLPTAKALQILNVVMGE